MTIVKAKEYYEIIASFCRKHELYKVENGEEKLPYTLRIEYTKKKSRIGGGW